MNPNGSSGNELLVADTAGMVASSNVSLGVSVEVFPAHEAFVAHVALRHFFLQIIFIFEKLPALPQTNLP